MATLTFMTHTIFDHGASKRLSKVLAQHGMSRPLLCTDRGLVDLSMVSDLTESVGHDAALTIYDGTPENPTQAAVEEAFDVFESSGVRDVRASAQVDKIAMPVEGQRLAARRDITDDLLFKFVISAVNGLVAGIMFIGFVIARFTTLKGMRCLDNFLHLGLEFGKIVRRNLTLRYKNVVIEAVFDGRANGELSLWENAQDGIRHQVGGRMAQHIQGFLVAFGE